MESVAPLEPIPEEEMPPPVLEEPQVSLSKDPFASPEKKKERRTRAEVSSSNRNPFFFVFFFYHVNCCICIFMQQSETYDSKYM